jgi:hypothetical protein
MREYDVGDVPVFFELHPIFLSIICKQLSLEIISFTLPHCNLSRPHRISGIANLFKLAGPAIEISLIQSLLYLYKEPAIGTTELIGYTSP